MIEPVNTKRILDLNFGDVFVYANLPRIVTKIENGFIYAASFSTLDNTVKRRSMAAFRWRSRERVEFWGNKKELLKKTNEQKAR